MSDQNYYNGFNAGKSGIPWLGGGTQSEGFVLGRSAGEQERRNEESNRQMAEDQQKRNLAYVGGGYVSSGSYGPPNPYNWAALRKGTGLGLLFGILGAICGFYIGVELSGPFGQSGNQAYIIAIAEFVGTLGFTAGLMLFRRLVIGVGVFCLGWWASHLAYPHIDFFAILIGFAQRR